MINEKIRIIVPIYNQEKYLNQCIDSIIKQTYTNFELLLIDDGSTDMSAEICIRWEKRDKRIRYIYQTNQGVSVARNTGLLNASGENIGFVDSDDWIDKNLYYKLIDWAKKYEANIVSCECIQTSGEMVQQFHEKTYVDILVQEYRYSDN